MAPREIKHLFTEKGEVLQAIIWWGAKTFPEIESIFNQSVLVQWTDLKVLLAELIHEGDIYLNEAGEYTANAELVDDYSYYEEQNNGTVEPCCVYFFAHILSKGIEDVSIKIYFKSNNTELTELTTDQFGYTTIQDLQDADYYFVARNSTNHFRTQAQPRGGRFLFTGFLRTHFSAMHSGSRAESLSAGNGEYSRTMFLGDT